MKDRHIKGCTRPGQSNDRNSEEESRDQPTNGHFETAEDNPDNVENEIHSVPAVNSGPLSLMTE